MQIRKCIAKKELFDHDFKTSAIHRKPKIPAGSEVQYIETICNFYGKYSKVKWNGFLYYVKPDDIEFVYA